MFALKNVLVATDFSEPAAAALVYGRELARQYGATLHLFSVVDDVAARYAVDYAPVFTIDMQRELEQATRTQVDGLLTPDERNTREVRAVVLTALSPAAAIVEYARQHDIDLIVVGTHGRSGLSHMFLGSVAERVVRTAPCPVLTVRHPEREFVAPDMASASAKA